MCDVHFVNKLLEWNCETQTHLCSALICVKPRMTKKALLSVLTVCFSCCWNFTTPAWLWQTDKQMTYIQQSTSAIQHCHWLGKSSRSLETFCVRAASQASQHFLKYIGQLKLEGENSHETSSVFVSLAEFVFVWTCESISSILCCLRLLRNCAPALSIIQNGAVGRALPELFHHPQWSLSMTTTGRWGTPAASTAPASTSLRYGSGRWCSRPPSLQFRLGW